MLQFSSKFWADHLKPFMSFISTFADTGVAQSRA